MSPCESYNRWHDVMGDFISCSLHEDHIIVHDFQRAPAVVDCRCHDVDYILLYVIESLYRLFDGCEM